MSSPQATHSVLRRNRQKMRALLTLLDPSSPSPVVAAATVPPPSSSLTSCSSPSTKRTMAGKVGQGLRPAWLLEGATAGRRKQQRYKGCLDGTSQASNKGRHKCPICLDYGHHWQTCKNGDPADIAAMLAERRPPKKRKKAAGPATTETSIVLASSARTMSFPTTTAPPSKKQKSTSADESTRSRAGSTQLDVAPICMVFPPTEQVRSPTTAKKSKEKKKENQNKETRKEKEKQKQGQKKEKEKEKLMKGKTQPNLHDSPAMSTRSKVSSLPSSPAMSTRSKRKHDSDMNF